MRATVCDIFPLNSRIRPSFACQDQLGRRTTAKLKLLNQVCDVLRREQFGMRTAQELLGDSDASTTMIPGMD